MLAVARCAAKPTRLPKQTKGSEPSGMYQKLFSRAESGLLFKNQGHFSNNKYC